MDNCQHLPAGGERLASGTCCLQCLHSGVHQVRHSPFMLSRVATAAHARSASANCLKQAHMTKKRSKPEGQAPQATGKAAKEVVAEPVPELPGAVHIDGSMLEGGGQILRNATALAAITRTPVHVDQIRAGRSKPGLSPQHLTGLQLIQQLSNGTLHSAAVRSTAIAFAPGPLCAGSYEADTHTAGSCTLMVQQALPCLLFAQGGGQDEASTSGRPATSHLDLRGGTDADFAPPIGYLTDVLVPTLRKLLGIRISVNLLKRGFYPKGGGRIGVEAEALGQGTALPAFDLSRRGKVLRITVTAFSAGKIPESAAQRMAAAATADLRAALPPDTQIEITTHHELPAAAVGDGAGVLIAAETEHGAVLGASAKGERGVLAEATGSIAAADMIRTIGSGAAVDEWMADQLIIYMALANGTSRMACAEPTLHARTAMVVAEKLLPSVHFKVTRPASGEGGGQGSNVAEQGTGTGQEAGLGLWLVECEGAGITA